MTTQTQPPISNQNVDPGCEKFKANAVVTKPIHGKFAVFDEGEEVLAQLSYPVPACKTYRVERVEWKGSLVALMNVICDVPEEHLRFFGDECPHDELEGFICLHCGKDTHHGA